MLSGTKYLTGREQLEVRADKGSYWWVTHTLVWLHWSGYISMVLLVWLHWDRYNWYGYGYIAIEAKGHRSPVSLGLQPTLNSYSEATGHRFS